MSQPNYLPEISPENIIDSLAEWDIQANLEELAAPTQPVIERIYSGLLKHLMGIDIQTYTAHRRIVSELEHPELTMDVTTMNVFVRYINHLVQIASAVQFTTVSSRAVTHFSILDLTNPDPARNRQIISGIINVGSFRDERLETFASHADKSTNAREQRDKLLRKHDELQKTRAALKEKRITQEPHLQDANQQVEALAAEVASKKRKQKEIRAAYELAKQQKAVFAQLGQSLQSDLSAEQQKNYRLQSRIVQSPDRLKKMISEMSFSASAERGTLTSTEERSRALQTRLDHLAILEQDMRSTLEYIKGIEQEVIKLNESMKNVSAEGSRLEAKRSELNELEAAKERIELQFENATGKLRRAQKHAEDRRQAAQDQIEKLKAEYEGISQERKGNDEAIETAKRHADEIERQIADLIATNKAEFNRIWTDYWRMRESLEIYMQTISKKLQMNVEIPSSLILS